MIPASLQDLVKLGEEIAALRAEAIDIVAQAVRDIAQQFDMERFRRIGK